MVAKRVIALVHNILPPYRVPLFNALSRANAGRFVVLLAQETHPNRSWRVPWEDVAFEVQRLRTVSFHVGDRGADISLWTSTILNRLQPTAVVVAGWDLPASWSTLVWARRRKVPAYAWVESWAGSGSLRGSITTWLRRVFLLQCRAAIVPGAAAATFVRHHVPGLRCVVAPNSVSFPVNRSSDMPTPPWSALFVGELSKRKGFDLILDAIPELLADFGQVTVAGNGPMASQVEALARRNSRVHYLGFLEGGSLHGAFRASSIVLVPSRKDPWPLVAAEALTAGRPVVLGPGVGSAPDLEQLAGSAAVRMDAADVGSLVRAARQARSQLVPIVAREAFQPGSVATRFLSVLN
jgi:glycosyltransferase involved in cell wall biosynthesis